MQENKNGEIARIAGLQKLQGLWELWDCGRCEIAGITRLQGALFPCLSVLYITSALESTGQMKMKKTTASAISTAVALSILWTPGLTEGLA